MRGVISRVLFLIFLTCGSAFAGSVATTNLLLNPGGEANSLTNWIAGGDSGPRIDNGSFDTGIKPYSGTNDFLAGTGVAGSLSQIVSIVGNPGVTVGGIDGGGLFAYVSFWEQGLDQGTLSDDAFVNVVFLGGTSNTLSVWTSPEIDSHLSRWSNYSTYLPLPPSTRFIQYSMNFVRHAGNDLDGFVDDNVLAIVDAVQLPRLSVANLTTNEMVYWPTFYSDGFVLQQNTNLVSTNWTVAAGPLKIVTGTNQVLFPPAGNQFFRLYHP
jgi:hypothetical protein